MIDRADLLLLAAVAIVLIVGLAATHVTLKKDGARVQKYRLFKVRDDLIYLVAAGKLNEDDFIFQEFYRASNYFVQATDLINVKTLVSALLEARRKGIDPAVEDAWRRVYRELQGRDPEVTKAVAGFYRAMTEILLENSWFVRMVVHHAWLC